MAANCTITDGDINSDLETASNESMDTDAELQKMSLEFFKLIDESKVDTPSFIPISREECERVIEDEKVVLTSIYESFKYLSEDNNTFEVNISFGDSRIGKEDEMSIIFQLPPDYPNSIPIFEINNSQSQILTFSGTDLLYDQLLQSAFDQRGNPMLYNLIQLVHESCEKVILFNKEHLLHQSLHEQARCGMFIPVVPAADNTPVTVEIAITETPVMHSNFHPSSFISLRGIIEACKSCGYSIKGVENILRPALAERFLFTQQKLSNMEKKYRKVRTISYTPEIVFHGTSENNLPSIVSKGLLVPGTERVRVVHGSAYGVGIYVGTSPSVSLGYSSSSKLLVCALLPGVLVSSFGANGAIGKEFEVYNGTGFYVIKNPRQLLPCWIISVHPENQQETSLGLLSAATKSATSAHPHNDTEISAEDKQALLEARMRKFLPFGFGPGDRTVILEAGEWDDDDDAILEGRVTDDSIIIDYGIVHEEKSGLQDFRFLDEYSIEPAESQ